MHCPSCKAPLHGGEKVCPRCGAQLGYSGNTVFYRKAAQSTLTFQDIFADVFKHHSRDDLSRLFAAGTPESTPTAANMLRTWQKPWAFLWVLLFGALTTVLLYVVMMTGIQLALPAFALVGAFTVPMAVLMLFWEMNIPRNVPFYEVMIGLFLGGTLSLLFTGVLGQTGLSSLSPAFIEEPAKLLALILLLHKGKRRYILNGILMGGAIGTGFDAMESMGYALMKDSSVVASVISRGATAIGGHMLWAALYGGALLLVTDGRPLRAQDLLDRRFLFFFLAAVGLHLVWDLPFLILPLPLVGDLKFVMLIVGGWLVLLRILKPGIRQVLETAGGAPAQDGGIRRAAVRGAQLVGVSGMYAGQTLSLEGTLTLGRDPQRCNLVFPPSVPGISRRHCTLQLLDGACMLTDCHSSCGTFLSDGSRLVPGESVSLRDGARFYLGSSRVQFEVRIRA